MDVYVVLVAPQQDCSCSEKTYKQYGNCDTNGWYRHGPLCYVKEPSNCHDLVTDGSYYPEGYSWEACEPKGTGIYIYISEMHKEKIMSIFINMVVHTLSIFQTGRKNHSGWKSGCARIIQNKESRRS